MNNTELGPTRTKQDKGLQGNIEHFKLPEIFQLLAHSRKSGTLGIQRAEDIVMVYFRNGQVIYAYGPRQTMHLGKLLKERGRITQRALNDAVAQQNSKSASKRLGAILIEMGAVDRADIIEVVAEQVRELVYSLLGWQTGSFKFYENEFPTDEEITIELSTENVILEGLRRLDEMNHLRDTLPDMRARLMIAQSVSHGINVSLSPEEWNLLALIDGRRTITDMVEISNLSEIDTLKKLAALKLAGLVTVLDKKTESTESQTKMAGGAEYLDGKMTHLVQLLEEFLHGRISPEPSAKTEVTKLTNAERVVGGRPLREIIAEGGYELTETDESETTTDEEKVWSEFTK